MLLAKLFMHFGLGEKLARLASFGVIGIAAVLAVLWLRADAHSDGVQAERAAWELAGKRLREQAAQSAGAASAAAVEREAEHAAQLEQEKERIDEATRDGASPLDAIFGPTGL